MMSSSATDKSSPTYGLITNFVLKTTNLSHLYIQNMNKKFITEESPIIYPAPLPVLDVKLFFFVWPHSVDVRETTGGCRSLYHVMDKGSITFYYLNNRIVIRI